MNLNDFPDFFFELHRVRPFPWQQKLMDEVTKNGWPRLIDLPTSAGKTAAMDIAIFHLALEADKDRERRAPVRIFFVVDRRLVVDEAYNRAQQISEYLRAASGKKHGILKEVASRLSLLSGDKNAPISVQRLRGGLPRERTFIRNPFQPAIIVSTVDQVGSRLLFRGYGVSEYMRPIHAALVGMDSVLILDEAHLSRPFKETLDWVEQYQGANWYSQPVGRPISIVEMTATPAKSSDKFSLSEEDQEHEILSARLNCTKPAQLVTVRIGKDNLDKTAASLVDTLTSEARKLMAELQETTTAPVVGVIFNRVATARSAFETLQSETGVDAILLTGRVRPYERDALVDCYLPRMRAGRSEEANVRPLYVVATQTVEVGAGLDFDGLVSEAAALDALRQRFGRLNRLGQRDRGPAVLVHAKAGPGNDVDPIYGEALAATWSWLDKQGKKQRGLRRKVIDFGINSMAKILPKDDVLAVMLTPTSNAPVLMPMHVDLLANTSPPPSTEPEISLHLHGIDAQPEDVQVVWRADLAEPMNPDVSNQAIETVDVLPPVTREVLSLPVWAARAFLQEAPLSQVADIEGGGRSSTEVPSRDTGKLVLQWRGEESKIIGANKIKPGDTIVIPSTYGGLDRFGWNPSSREEVMDIADKAVSEQWGIQVMRIHPALIRSWFEGDEASESLALARKALQDTLTRYQEGEDLSFICGELLYDLLSLQGLRPTIHERLESLSTARREIVYPTKAPQGILFRALGNKPGEFTDEDDSASLTQKVLLENHCRGVAELAHSYSEKCGVPDRLASDIELAAKLHDLGKADPRFQTWLRGGASSRDDNRLLAKSERLAANDRFSIQLAREQAGYPKGARHECYSVAIAHRNPVLLDAATDKDLVLHLIGVHHGRGRPFQPTLDDAGMPPLSFRFIDDEIKFRGAHGLEALDSGWVEQYWRLIRRYGYWGLAYLETLIRLADHTRSADGH